MIELYELINWNGNYIITFKSNDITYEFYINHKLVDSLDIMYISYCIDSINYEVASNIVELIKIIISDIFPNINNYSIVLYSDKLFLEKYMEHSAKLYNMPNHKFKYGKYYGIISTNSHIENHILNITSQLSEI